MSGHSLTVAAAAIDSGDGMTTAGVYSFVRRTGAGRAIAVSQRVADFKNATMRC